MEDSTNSGQTTGRKEPILVNRSLAEIHSTDCSIYIDRKNRQMDGYKERGGEEEMGIGQKCRNGKRKLRKRKKDQPNSKGGATCLQLRLVVVHCLKIYTC